MYILSFNVLYEIPKYDRVINRQLFLCNSPYLLCKFVCPSGLQVLCVCMCDVHGHGRCGRWVVWINMSACVCVHVSLCG